MTTLAILVASGFIVAAIGIVAVIILFHLDRYGVQGDATPFIRRVFIAGNLFFLLLTVATLVMLLRV